MTRRAYLFIHSSGVGTREEVRDFIDNVPEILNWRYDVPHAFYLISECDAHEITERILQFTEGEGRFLITEVAENSQGWLPRGAWRFLNEKTPAKASSSPRKARAAKRRGSSGSHPAEAQPR